MKKALLAFGMLLLTASSANAGGLVSKHASSVQLTVDAARATSSRIGSSFSISGSNVATTYGTTAELFPLALSLQVFTAQVQYQQFKVLMNLRSRLVSHTLKLMQFPVLLFP